MRIRRTVLTLAALAALLCGPAAARAKDIFDDVEWSALKTVEPVGDASANAVFVVSDGNTTVIAKFSPDVPVTINFADKFLEGRKVPVPRSLTLSLSVGKAKTAKEEIAKKVQDTRLTGKINRATTLSLFDPVKSPGGMGTVQNVLQSFTTKGTDTDLDAIKKAAGDKKLTNITAPQRKRLNDQLTAVRELARCLSDANQTKLLGRVYTIDAFLGNGDRMQKSAGGQGGEVNWRNLMLATGTGKKTTNFVAIDNRAFAPSLKEWAWLLNYNAAVTKLGNNPRLKDTDLPATVDGKEWVKALVHGRTDNDNKAAGILAETGTDCCDLDLALKYDAQSKVIAGDMRKLLHKLLFTEMKGLAESVTLSTNSPVGTEFPDLAGAKITRREKAPDVTAKVWVFTIPSVSDQGTMSSYTAFKIDWDGVEANIANGMKEEMGTLVGMFPRSAAKENIPTLDLEKFKSSGLMTTRKQALDLAGEFPDTVAPEALFVRLGYLALRQPKPDGILDPTAQEQIVKVFWKQGADTKVDCKPVYLAPPEGAPLRRKP